MLCVCDGFKTHCCVTNKILFWFLVDVLIVLFLISLIMHCHQESNRVRFTYSTEIVLVTELQRQTDCKIFELHRFLKLKSVEHGLFLLLVLVKGIFIKSIRNPVTGKGAQHRVRKHEPIKTLVNLLLRHEILRCAHKKRARANKNRA